MSLDPAALLRNLQQLHSLGVLSDTQLAAGLDRLRTQFGAEPINALIAFGPGSRLGDVMIGDVAGGGC